MRNLKYFTAISLVFSFSFPGVALSQLSKDRISDLHRSPFSGQNRANSRLSQSRNLKISARRKMLQTKLVPVSNWGGSGIRISIEQKSVKIGYACADGEIVGRLKVDSRGNFKANGFHIRQRPGPITLDDKSQRQPARFEGKIVGKTMTVSIILTETGENIGNFELKRDVAVRLQRCL